MTDTTTATIEAIFENCTFDLSGSEYDGVFCMSDTTRQNNDGSKFFCREQAGVTSIYAVGLYILTKHALDGMIDAAVKAARAETHSALAAERDAALRERDAGAKDYCALMERHDAEFVRAEKAETEAAALRGEVERMRSAAEAMIAEYLSWKPIGEHVYVQPEDHPAVVALRAALTSKGGEG